MVVQKSGDEIIIRIPSSMDIEAIQEFLTYLKYQEATHKSQATQEGVDSLVREIKKGRWAKRRAKLIK